MKPTLSVCVISFNQVRYISECLQSIVDQRVDVPFEVIIGDDCSTDGTAEVIDTYVAAFPHLVKVVKHSGKVGGTANLLAVHDAAAGEFVAHMDGDDCMLPGKLQKQVDFLRGHPDHAFVAHDVQIMDDKSQVTAPTFGVGDIPRSATIEYLVSRGCYFAHSSKMYRKAAARTHAGRRRATVDFYFHIEHALSGPIGYIDQVLGRYRKTSSGVTSPMSGFLQDVLQGHLDAYEYALQCGVDESIVLPARLKFRYVNAMRSLRSGRLGGFEMLRAVPRQELEGASLRERFVMQAPARVVQVSMKVFDAVMRRH